MKNIFLNLIAASILAAPAAAGGFDLNSFSADDVRAAAIAVPAPAALPAEDEMIGLDASIRIPFKAIQKQLERVQTVTILDQSAPVLSKAGDFLKVSNIRVDVNGITAIPTLTLKPYFEGKDKLALRIQRIQLHAEMMPDKGPAAAQQPQLTQEDIMEQVMAALTKGVMKALNERLAAQGKTFKAEDVLTLKYDKAAWTLRAAISPKLVQSYLPQGLIGDIHLTGFSFNETCIAVKVGTAN